MPGSAKGFFCNILFHDMANLKEPKPPVRITREVGRKWLPKEPITIQGEDLYVDMIYDRAQGMKGVPSGVKTGIITTALLSAWLNFVPVKENYNEHMYGQRPLTGVSSAIYENQALKKLVEDTYEDVCQTIHKPEFFARFFKYNEDGTKSFNYGSVLVPLGFSISERCKRQMFIEVALPSEFSRKFANIKSLTPEQEKTILDEMVRLLKERMSDQIIMQRSWEALEIYGLNSGKYFDEATGKIRFDLNDTRVKGIEMTGLASNEDEKFAGPKSIGNSSPDNEKLAKQRLDDVYKIAKQAFEQAGIGREAIENIKLSSLERVLDTAEVGQLGQISESIFGVSSKPNYEKVFELIKYFNANDPRVLTYFSTHKAEENLFKSLVSGQRGVKMKFEIEGDFNKNHVYELLTPLPLLVILALLYNLLTLKKRNRYAEEFDRLRLQKDITIEPKKLEPSLGDAWNEIGNLLAKMILKWLKK